MFCLAVGHYNYLIVCDCNSLERISNTNWVSGYAAGTPGFFLKHIPEKIYMFSRQMSTGPS